ncbi:NGG1p interacting factor 3 [Aaosphaeria arxii CBS 175.79]|uniref:NGG1p interacting factor 3 n=1 Tax=Aaosphaeria arxii CBS 175.79 TaxID=1450172 RepID=A0A6A5XH74_9PLEO|nr:NGG1p interacting factor 3 [Aaosphaeria arxii CBS 175.79]KAF2012151.1 NGG1p interacting factor 3 [Aaosphaeria arxii CBS 175.79]
MSVSSNSAPFSRATVRAMQRLYPKALADNSWDNTGLLLEAPFDPARRRSNKVLLTIDLTRAVADEAIALDSSIIIAYHPIIFRGLKSLTLENTQQQTLLRLASHGISVYSPHTAVDAAPGGLGDWLADIVTATKTNRVSGDLENNKGNVAQSVEQDDPFVDKKPPVFTLHNHPSQAINRSSRGSASSVPHSRRPIVPQTPELASHLGAGMGRVVTFDEPQPLATLLDRIGKGLNNPKGFPIAIPQNKTISDISISSVGICAGSGSSLFSGLKCDLLFTGEMSHHEALAAIENGQVVISLFHSNSERGFLGEVLRDQLEEAITEEWDKVRTEEEGNEEIKEALGDEGFDVLVSEVDRDPYGIVILKGDAE